MLFFYCETYATRFTAPNMTIAVKTAITTPTPKRLKPNASLTANKK
ncbi:hypothetical protein SM124_13420 [Bacillus sp. 31A1R]|uniref:Uncharacterized protein n=1 Tax=Robertmurraya mangrovi TaxID=3098077 RepID=A0ABU5J044_9BACI|nr:hypothetical protein [Bacillus sp. 31A1R]MDZ5472727.1 hypothetical protein [Bacillus sp. 31A1R]